MKNLRSHVISDKDPKILDWLKKSREADKGTRPECEEASPCGSSSASLQEFYETGAIANGHRLRQRGGSK